MAHRLDKFTEELIGKRCIYFDRNTIINIFTLELFERIERFARMEGNAGAVVPDEESEPERTGSESGTISGRDWSTTSSLRRCFQQL